MSEVDMSEVYKALKELGNKYEKVENSIVQKGADFLAKKVEENTPVWAGKKIYSTYWNNHENKRIARRKPEHAKDDVIVSKAKNGLSEIGYGEDSYWYMHMVEFGTFKIKPQAFLEKTDNEYKDDVTNILANELRKELL